MSTITIGGRSFETPVLVPSISSFETQIKPVAALRLQLILQEPISLVSAYDVWFDDSSELEFACADFRKQGILLMDSGGYEATRISSYVGEAKQKRWDFSKYKEIAAKEIYDFIFSYDYFLDPGESSGAYAERLVRQFKNHSKILEIKKLIPVVHIQSIDGHLRVPDKDIEELFGAIAKEVKCTFIAVPERELGDGITHRAHLARRISLSIQRANTGASLHILGCGNLLSYSVLAVAGAMMCDGLEWCRTLAADNFHLHHFQQKDVFADPGYHTGNPVAEALVNGDLDYRTAVAVRNLLSFQAFIRDIHSRLRDKKVHEFVSRFFGDNAGNAVLAFEK